MQIKWSVTKKFLVCEASPHSAYFSTYKRANSLWNANVIIFVSSRVPEAIGETVRMLELHDR